MGGDCGRQHRRRDRHTPRASELSALPYGPATGAGQPSYPDIRAVAYEHADAALLTGEVQQEYVRRYGSPDESPIEAGHFAAPDGAFAVAYLDGVPVAMGGWRRRVLDDPAGPAAEVKRMYVRETARGRGLARALLAWLEQSARAGGLPLMVLETGQVQPEALGLYRSSGYADIPAYGYYADSDLSVYLGKPL